MASVHIPKVMEFAGMSDPFSSAAVVIASVNTTAHETGHLLGLRHYDSFLMPGTGFPTESFLWMILRRFILDRLPPAERQLKSCR